MVFVIKFYQSVIVFCHATLDFFHIKRQAVKALYIIQPDITRPVTELPIADFSRDCGAVCKVAHYYEIGGVSNQVSFHPLR